MAVFICSKAAFDQILCDFLNEFFDCWVQILPWVNKHYYNVNITDSSTVKTNLL